MNIVKIKEALEKWILTLKEIDIVEDFEFAFYKFDREFTNIVEEFVPYQKRNRRWRVNW